MRDSQDRELGMDCPITRRDFLNGSRADAGRRDCPFSVVCRIRFFNSFQLLPSRSDWVAGEPVGSFEVAHEVRDGTFWDHAGSAKDPGEVYDLVVVGGGSAGFPRPTFFVRLPGPRREY